MMNAEETAATAMRLVEEGAALVAIFPMPEGGDWSQPEPVYTAGANGVDFELSARMLETLATAMRHRHAQQQRASGLN